MKNIAVISPSQNAYSETFIHAHKSLPNICVKYYYDGSLPGYLEGLGKLSYSNNSILINSLVPSPEK
jgi:colanic acid/amylovoran biosynthesis glycosyltransferase